MKKKTINKKWNVKIKRMEKRKKEQKHQWKRWEKQRSFSIKFDQFRFFLFNFKSISPLAETTVSIYSYACLQNIWNLKVIRVKLIVDQHSAFTTRFLYLLSKMKCTVHLYTNPVLLLLFIFMCADFLVPFGPLLIWSD